jgi:2-polyprenyl-3-methyl-5-hydroxy-6-metoxy-1,4-benzoquinol methylase
MNTRYSYSDCPVCRSNKISPVLTAVDYTVSKEEFSIWHCDNCSLRFTQSIPEQSGIGRYYQSAEYISHSDTGKGIINRLYHIVRKRTLAGKRKLIQNSTGLRKGHILDVGAGTGAFLNEMKTAMWSTTGIEPDTGAREMAKKLYNLELGDPHTLFDLPQDNYDAITLWHVLEHVHDLNGYIVRLKKLLKSTGKLFIAVPNYTSHDAAAYGQYWAAYDVPRHLYHFSPESMQRLMEVHGLKIIAHKPMWYDSFYVSLLSSKNKNGKPGFLGAVSTGLVSNFSAFFNVKKCSSVIYIIAR